VKFAAAALLGLASAHVSNDVEQAFVAYISKHGKSYGTRAEYQFRLETFAKSF
jgi:hypothetical protein